MRLDCDLVDVKDFFGKIDNFVKLPRATTSLRTWFRTCNSDSVTLSVSSSSFLYLYGIVDGKQINRPVPEVEENEYERKGNACKDVDPRAALGAAGEQFVR